MNQPFQYNAEAVRETLELFSGGGPVEIRILRPFGVRGRTDAGIFDNYGMAAGMLSHYAKHPKTPAVYFVMNSIDPALMNRARNRFAEAVEATAADGDIIRRRWLLIDLDPVRPAEIMADDSERESARLKALQVAEFLRGRQWPEPVFGDSGNGYHLYYPIDSPADEPSRDGFKNALRALASKFDDSRVRVDTKVFNAARITKLFGTPVRKGDSSRERPHRMSAVLQRPDSFAPMNFALVESLAAEAPQQKPRTARRANAAGGRKQMRTPILERARRYLAKIPPAVSGESGHDRTFAAACAMVKGFDLRPDDAFELLREWNTQCSPPWSESELRHKLGDAEAADGERGYLLTAPEDSATLQPADGALDEAPEHEAPGLPVVRFDFDERAAADSVICELGKRPNIFRTEGGLVQLLATDDGTRPHALNSASLRELISSAVVLVDKTQGAQTRPPKWLTDAIAARPDWPGVRRLRGIRNSPAIRFDGTLISSPGYDQASGLFCEFSAQDWPEIPENPGRADAAAAVRKLADVTCDFPFSTAADRSGWLAALLTVVGRQLIAGPCPGILFDASIRGAGKSMLCDLIGIIAAGGAPPRSSWSVGDESEARKKLSSILFAPQAPAICLFDNIGGRLRSDALEAVLTAGHWEDRILGQSLSKRVPIATTFLFSGNNTQLSSDLSRRLLRVRLEPADETPEERAGFRYPDLKGHVQAHRQELLTCALIALSAYVREGCPGSGELTPWGSFEHWSTIVRGCLVWAGQSDPATTRRAMREESDSDAEALAVFIEMLREVDPWGHGLSTDQMIGFASGQGDPGESDLVRVALETIAGKPLSQLSSRTIGNALAKFRGRPMAGFRLERRKSNGRAIWNLRPVSASFAEDSDSVTQVTLSPATHGNENSEFTFT